MKHYTIKADFSNFDKELKKLEETTGQSQKHWSDAKVGWLNFMEELKKTERRGGE